MDTGQIAGGLLSIFGNAGAGGAEGFNTALTKEEDTEIEKKKQEALNKFRLSLEGLRAQNNIAAEDLRAKNAMTRQTQQQDWQGSQSSSGKYLNGKLLTKEEFNQLSDTDKKKVITVEDYQNQQSLKTLPSGYFQNGKPLTKAEYQAYLESHGGQPQGLLNTDQFTEKLNRQKIDFFNKTHPKTPEKLSLEKEIYQDLIKKGMSPEEAAEKLWVMKKGGGSKKDDDLENNNGYLKGTMLEYNKGITYKDIQKLNDRARKRAKEEIEKLELEKGQVSEQQIIQIKKAAKTAEYANAGHFRKETLKGGVEAYVHKNKKNGKIDSMFTLLGEPIRFETGNKSSPGVPGGTDSPPPQKANEPTEVKNQSQADASSPKTYPPLTIEGLQKMVNPQYKIDNPISAMTGNKTYTESNTPTLLTRAQEWMGQTQRPDSETPHTGEGSIEAALRYVNIGKENLQARKNVADQLRQYYPDLSDEQIADMVLNAGKQSTGILNPGF